MKPCLEQNKPLKIPLNFRNGQKGEEKAACLENTWVAWKQDLESELLWGK